jgi:hypothetical protein
LPDRLKTWVAIEYSARKAISELKAARKDSRSDFFEASGLSGGGFKLIPLYRDSLGNEKRPGPAPTPAALDVIEETT